MDKTIILSSISKEELLEEILSGVQTLINKSESSTHKLEENWTAKEVAQFCKVSLVTIYDWTKKGILTKYKIGNRIFYKSAEVEKAIIKL